MKNNIRLSIIVPCYNCELTIKKAVNSILENSYIDTEIILINDGSTDKTLDKLYEIKKTNQNIKIINKKNTGVSDTRNIGINISKGKYIGFVDSDDFVTNNMFKKLIDYADKNNVDIVFCNFLEKIKNNFFKSKFIYKEGRYNSKFIIQEFLKGRVSISIWDKIYKKEILNDITFNTKISVGEDLLFCLEVIEKSNKVYCTNEPLYIYVQNNTSTVHKLSYKLLEISFIYKYINPKYKNKYKEYNYFVANCMLRSMHTLSYCYNKKTKTKVIDLFKKIYDIEKIKVLIFSKYSPIFTKVEMIILYLFGINYYLKNFRFYDLIKKGVRRWKK